MKTPLLKGLFKAVQQEFLPQFNERHRCTPRYTISSARLIVYIDFFHPEKKEHLLQCTLRSSFGHKCTHINSFSYASTTLLQQLTQLRDAQ